MRIKLTERVVDRLRAPDPSGRQSLHWDSDLRGFGVLASGVTNAKTYIVQRAVGGRTRRVTIAPTNVVTLIEARARAADLLADMHRGVDPRAGRRGAATLRRVLDDYLLANKSLRPRAREFYRATVERWFAAWLDAPMRAITPDLVEARHREIREAVASGGRYSGNASANAAMRALRTLWNFAAERDGDLAPNPVRRLRRQWYPVPRRERVVRTEDLPKFYAAVRGLENAVNRDYLLLLLFTGLRRGEAARLRWEDVDLAAGVIRVPAASTKSGRKLELPMSDLVRDVLVARRAIGRASHVFPSNSASGHLEEPKFALAQVAEACGVRISAHDLRRTFITVAEACDVSPIALKRLVNHAIGADVTSGYVVMTTERLREPTQRVADRFKALIGMAAPANVVALR